MVAKAIVVVVVVSVVVVVVVVLRLIQYSAVTCVCAVFSDVLIYRRYDMLWTTDNSAKVWRRLFSDAGPKACNSLLHAIQEITDS